MKRCLLLLLLPYSLLAQVRTQTDVGLRLGLTTFRDDLASSFRYDMPTAGLWLNRQKQTGQTERSLSVGLEWGSKSEAGRFFEQTAGLSVGIRRTYALGSSAENRFRLGWQGQVVLRTYYDGLAFDDASTNHVGGYAAIELTPVLQYRLSLRLAGRRFALTDYLAVPLINGLVAGNNAGTYSAGVAFPGTYTGLNNLLGLTPDASPGQRWRIGYQWGYRAIRLTNAQQQHAYNGLIVCYLVH